MDVETGAQGDAYAMKEAEAGVLRTHAEAAGGRTLP